MQNLASPSTSVNIAIDNVVVVGTLAFAAFGAYQVVKLGVDWGKEGVRTVRSRRSN